jgi:hypothetical protein
MPLRRKVLGAVPALGLVVLLAGCGGPKNPVRTVNSAAPFFDGWWDGVWEIPVFIWKLITTGHTYNLHLAHAGSQYNIGWIVGMIVFFVLVYWIVGSFFDFAGGVLLGIAVVLVVALIIGISH